MGNRIQSTPRMRFAIYTRISSELQNAELSLEAQELRCREAIIGHHGIVIEVYSDSEKSGWSLDRPGFQEMRRADEKGSVNASGRSRFL